MLQVRSHYWERSRINVPTAMPYCRCSWCKNQHFSSTSPLSNDNQNSYCSCGEEDNMKEWKWRKPDESEPSSVELSENDQLVTFHPHSSTGTASVKGDTPFTLNYHYYWEVKMLTPCFGTDIMVGVGSDNFNLTKNKHEFSSLLGTSSNSYGLSYKGVVQHKSQRMRVESEGFCKGSIIGVRLDMCDGTLMFYINRKSCDVTFYNVRRHCNLYPMMCSTATQSTLKTIYSASWQASLLVDALKILAASASEKALLEVPAGVLYRLKKHFWLAYPAQGFMCDCNEPCTKTHTHARFYRREPSKPSRGVVIPQSRYRPNKPHSSAQVARWKPGNRRA